MNTFTFTGAIVDNGGTYDLSFTVAGNAYSFSYFRGCRKNEVSKIRNFVVLQFLCKKSTQSDNLLS